MTTARLEYENKVLRDQLAQLIEAAGDAVILLAREGTIVSASLSSQRLFCVAGSPAGRSMLELISSGEIPSLVIGRSRRVSVDELRAWIRRKQGIGSSRGT